MGIAPSSVRRIAGTTVAAVLALVLAPAGAAAAPADTGSNITPAERDEILEVVPEHGVPEIRGVAAALLEIILRIGELDIGAERRLVSDRGRHGKTNK